MVARLLILLDASCCFSNVNMQEKPPQFGQMVQIKREEEDVYMQHNRALLSTTAIYTYELIKVIQACLCNSSFNALMYQLSELDHLADYDIISELRKAPLM